MTKYEEPLKYYEKHYKGKTQIEIKRLCLSLYRALKYRKQLKLLPHGVKGPTKWKNPLEDYKRLYPGLSRGDLHNINKGLYSVLNKKGLLKYLPVLTQEEKTKRQMKVYTPEKKAAWTKKMKIWAEKNPEKVKERNRKARETIKNKPQSEYSLFAGFRNLVKSIKYRPKGHYQTCEYCGKFFFFKSLRKTCSDECKAKRGGNLNRGKKRPYFCGKNNPAYTNGNYLKKYRRIRVNGKQVYEHIYVCLKKNGLKKLPEGYCVHHIDGDKFNNSPGNLRLMSIKDHNQLHREKMSHIQL